MLVKKAEIIITAVKEHQYPPEGISEIALAGRSNVGKSSLINTLINRKNLARTSGQPGKTQTINFYNINDTFRFVDLPGYGYAKVSRKEREKWADMINRYLTKRQSLREVVLLVDIRHSPGEHDKMMYDWIKSIGFSGIVVATKADKLSKNQQARQIAVISRELGIEDRKLIVSFSATKKQNKDKVWNILDEILDI
ncbi:ribosome biogenesis GTP-binding protein YihA/YsxC [Clostridium sp. D2Q-14]|uniref:ribosome biogenesis GTP-binding protein YihA/YsxC n=1 Tax=Anaeromonas gelatinilytica TaxID=2683194 RepID=UPI00193B9B80|nr:ribosome biogenesis GTP-binding protein YihA/YsxC [Anaeromonas gelatinilytica]MBS4535817.1 ribosome biogenesis GTP-binding protein YihA/YsxC [Anaeromonas gelatinilytica]